MAAGFKVEIVTPDRVRFDGQANGLTLQGSEGQMGILAHHAPTVALLDPGIMRVETPNGVEVYAAGEGFVQIRPSRTTVIVEFAEKAEDIDVEASRKAVTEAEKALQTPSTPEARKRQVVAWKAAQARAQVAAGRK